MSTEELKPSEESKDSCLGGCLPRRKSILIQAATESTAHGLSRTVGERHWLVRLSWFAAFLVVVGLLLSQLVGAVKRLASQPVSTSVSTNAEPFVFPDVHICSYPMISASYSATMGAAEQNYTNWQMDRIVNLLRLANISGDELTRLAAQIFVGTVPYSFLSRNMGMRMEQSIIGATVMPITQNLQLGVDIIHLSHYKFLNCFSIRINSSNASSLLNNVMGYLDISLFADATYNSTLKLRYSSIDVRGLGYINYEFLIGSGFRVYFTEQGRYPDEYSTSVAISPGFHHQISLSMRINSLAKDKNQCAKDMPPEKIYDPLTKGPVEYNYSLGSCYAKSLNRMFRTLGLNCYIPGYGPILYSNKDLDCCNNLTRVLQDNYSSPEALQRALDTVDLIRQIYNGSVVQTMVDSVNMMQSDCKFGRPCYERTYVPSVTSVLFPMRQGLKTELTNVFKQLTTERQAEYFVPGREWMMRLFESAYGPNSTAASEDELATVASENILRLYIFTEEQSSTVLEQRISYLLEDLMAGIGGLMGLFMGGSVLTLIELVELIVSLAFGRRLTAPGNREASKTGDDSTTRSSSYDNDQRQGQGQSQLEMHSLDDHGFS